MAKDPDFEAQLKTIAVGAASQIVGQLGELVQAVIYALHAATEYLDAKRAEIAPDGDDDEPKPPREN